jgi:hypothetical protein
MAFCTGPFSGFNISIGIIRDERDKIVYRLYKVFRCVNENEIIASDLSHHHAIVEGCNMNDICEVKLIEKNISIKPYQK